MNLFELLGNWLKKADATEHVDLGKKTKEVKLSSEDKLILIKQLEEVRLGSTKFAILAGTAHILVFVSAIVFSWYYRDQSKIVLSIIGASAATLVGIATKLVGLWREKVATDILICILPSLSPLEAVKVTQGFFDSLKSTNNEGGRKRRNA